MSKEDDILLNASQNFACVLYPFCYLPIILRTSLHIMQIGVDTVPVLIGPVSYLLLSKPAKGVEKTFSLLSLLDKILPIYK